MVTVWGPTASWRWSQDLNSVSWAQAQGFFHTPHPTASEQPKHHALIQGGAVLMVRAASLEVFYHQQGTFSQ